MSESLPAGTDKPNAKTVAPTMTAFADCLPSQIETAWQQFISRVKNADPKQKAMLRAAFDAGVEVARPILKR